MYLQALLGHINFLVRNVIMPNLSHWRLIVAVGVWKSNLSSLI